MRAWSGSALGCFANPLLPCTWAALGLTTRLGDVGFGLSASKTFLTGFGDFFFSSFDESESFGDFAAASSVSESDAMNAFLLSS